MPPRRCDDRNTSVRFPSKTHNMNLVSKKHKTNLKKRQTIRKLAHISHVRAMEDKVIIGIVSGYRS